MDNPVRVVLVGAGSRGNNYAGYALKAPERMRIQAVVDPSAPRRAAAAERFGIADECLFASVEQFVASGCGCDAAINTTMDELHVPLSLPLLAAGLDLLVEKPVSLDEASLLALYEAAMRYGRKVMVCHVLRYTPFYSAIKQALLDGAVGEIKAIQTEENVSFHHMTASYIRGKWGNSDACGSRIMMAKCCHDLDLLTWLKSGVPAARVASFGTLHQYRADQAPKGAGRRCLVDCVIEVACPYSAKLHYVDKDIWHYYAWSALEDAQGRPLTEAEKIASLQGDNPFGRCVWHADNNVEDVQSVLVQFADGTIATHMLNGGVPKPCRILHVVGTLGELYGVFEEGWYTIRRPSRDLSEMAAHTEERFTIDESLDGHGGGDKRIIVDFINAIQGKPVSISYTGLEDSILGHQIGFAAARAMDEHCVEEIVPLGRG